MSTPAAAAPATDLLYARSAALVVLAGVLWSMGGLLVKLVEAADSIQIVLYRSLFVIPVAAGFIAVPRRRPASAARWHWAGTGCSARSASPAAFVTFVTALTLTTVANAAFVLATTPFVDGPARPAGPGRAGAPLDLAGHGAGRPRAWR